MTEFCSSKFVIKINIQGIIKFKKRRRKCFKIEVSLFALLLYKAKSSLNVVVYMMKSKL